MDYLEDAKNGNKFSFEQLILENQYAIYKTARVFFQEERSENTFPPRARTEQPLPP